MAGSWQNDFHSAVATKNVATMRRAIASGMPIDKHILGFSNEFTPLHYAIYESDGTAVVGVLIAAGRRLRKLTSDIARHPKHENY